MRLLFTGAAENPALSFGKCRGLVRRELDKLCTVIDDDPDDDDLQLYLGIPLWNQRSKWEAKTSRFVWFTMWEWPEIPHPQIERINASQGLITLTQWTDRIFEDAGVTVPRFIVPFGVDPQSYHYKPKDRDPDRPFTFLWVGFNTGHIDRIAGHGLKRMGDRKRGWLVRRAFEQLDLPDARLILKSVPWPNSPINFIHNTKSGGEIHELSQWVPEDEMVRLYREADVLVWPTYGEGFGLPPLEAAAVGTPSILPNHSAIEDYFDPEWLIELPHRDGRIWPKTRDPMTGACVSCDALMSLMLDAYRDRDRLATMGKVGADVVSKNWTYEIATRPALKTMLNHYEGGANATIG